MKRYPTRRFDRKHSLQWIFYQVICIPALLVVNKVFFGLRIEGRENLKGVKGAVLVCNHLHYLDCTAVALAMWPSMVSFVSQKENFEIRFAGMIQRMCGAIELDKSPQGFRIFMQRVGRELDRGRKVCVFPEGNLVLYNQVLQPFREGAFLIAKNSSVPVLPIGLSLRKPAGIMRLYKSKPLLTVRIGSPLHPDPDLSERTDRKRLKEEAFSTIGQTLLSTGLCAFQPETTGRSRRGYRYRT